MSDSPHAAGGDDKLSFAPGLDPMLLHGASYSLLAHSGTVCHQLFAHLGPAVLAPDLGVDGPNVGQQGFITDTPVGACRDCPLPGDAGAQSSHWC